MIGAYLMCILIFHNYMKAKNDTMRDHSVVAANHLQPS